MILITGAAGKTGKAILQALSSHSEPVRVFVHNMQQANALLALGAHDVEIGDLRDELALANAVEGIHKIYYICPNMTPDEAVIGQKLLTLAFQGGVQRFVYHSVLHPQIEAMPHHWQKLLMEEQIFTSGLDFTILQPCAYMQNILGSWQSIQQQGIFPVPYRTSAKISIVDLQDVAEVAAKVLIEDGHQNAIYELSGPESLSQDEVAAILCTQLQKSVVAKEIDRAGWSEQERSSGLGEFEINTLLMMFEYYEKFGFQGNAKILEYLLNKPATSLDIFISRQLELETNIKNLKGTNH